MNHYKCYLCGYVRIFTDEEASDEDFCLGIASRHRLTCSRKKGNLK